MRARRGRCGASLIVTIYRLASQSNPDKLARASGNPPEGWIDPFVQTAAQCLNMGLPTELTTSCQQCRIEGIHPIREVMDYEAVWTVNNPAAYLMRSRIGCRQHKIYSYHEPIDSSISRIKRPKLSSLLGKDPNWGMNSSTGYRGLRQPRVCGANRLSTRAGQSNDFRLTMEGKECITVQELQNYGLNRTG